MAELDSLFNPESIAVIGASSTPGKIGYQVLKNIIDAGYEHEIYPINISGDTEILGKRTYKSILDVPDKIDLTVYALPAKYAPQIMDECGRKGVKGVVIISGGFKELSEEGAEFEKQTLKNAKEYDIRIIGPNCMGILNPRAQFDTFFQPRYAMSRPESGGVAVLTQSGTYGISILEWLAQENLGVSKFVSYGNKSDVDEIEMLRYLENDNETRIIAIYMEGLDNGKHFIELASKIGRNKPIVMLKAGRTSLGSKAAKSHTGSLAGNDAVFTGAMRQCGVITVDDVDELIDVVKILSMQPLPKGKGIALLTNGVGPCVVAVDEIAETSDLKLAAIREESVKRLKESLPDFCIFGNPLDLTGSATAEFYKRALDILNNDDNIHVLMPFFVFQDAPLSETIEELHGIMNTINDSEKTLLCVASGGDFTRVQVARIQESGIPCIPTPKRAVLALSRVVWYAEFLRESG